LTLVFWLLIGMDKAGFIAVLDAEYRANGFCVADHETHGFNSYQMCFFIDTAACAILLSMEKAREYHGYTASVFVHGCFHFAQYIYGWPMPEMIHIIAYTLFTLAFLGGFGIGSKAGSKTTLAVTTLIVVLVERFLIPTSMSFAYTNAWIYATATAVSVSQPPSKKNSFGTSWFAVLVFLAGTVFPFFEGVMCNQGVKALGGHAIFDAIISFGTLVAAVTLNGDDRKAI